MSLDENDDPSRAPAPLSPLGELVVAQLRARRTNTGDFRKAMHEATGEKLSRQRYSKWIHGVRPELSSFIAMLHVLAVPTSDRPRWFHAAGYGEAADALKPPARRAS